MTPQVSIVIPLKRQEDAWLEQCVRSAVEQSAPCETIVVYSETTPESNLETLRRIAVKHAELRVARQESGGFPGAINTGIRAARGGRVGLLLSDDWLSTEAVERCLAVDADIVCSGHTVYRADGVTLVQGAGMTPTEARYRALPTIEAKAGYLEHFFLFRKQTLLDAGGLDESIGNFPGIDDYDLIWTLLERGATVRIVEERLYHYRDHDGERLTLADPEEAARNFEKILRKHGVAEPEIPAMVRRAARWFGRPVYAVADAR